MVPRHRHRVCKRDVLRSSLRDEARTQRVRRKLSLHTRQQTPRLNDVAHSSSRQRAAQVAALEYAAEEGTLADPTFRQPFRQCHASGSLHGLVC